MEGGDISNQVSPRILIEFEDIIGAEPKPSAGYLLARRLGRWNYVVRRWEISGIAVRVIYDRAWRLGQTIDVITTQPDEFADALSEYFDEMALGVKRVWSFSPEDLGKQLSYLHHIAAVYTADPRHRRLYGSKGILVTDENVTQIGL